MIFKHLVKKLSFKFGIAQLSNDIQPLTADEFAPGYELITSQNEEALSNRHFLIFLPFLRKLGVQYPLRKTSYELFIARV